MRTTEQIVSNLNAEQKQLLADIINYGCWGDTDAYLKGNEEAVSVIGYITNDAHEGGHFERKGLGGRVRSLLKALGLNGTTRGKSSEEMEWMYEWWGKGTDSILLIHEDIANELEKWANNF